MKEFFFANRYVNVFFCHSIQKDVGLKDRTMATKENTEFKEFQTEHSQAGILVSKLEGQSSFFEINF
jgi:hypothetical protein